MEKVFKRTMNFSLEDLLDMLKNDQNIYSREKMINELGVIFVTGFDRNNAAEKHLQALLKVENLQERALAACFLSFADSSLGDFYENEENKSIWGLVEINLDNSKYIKQV